MAADPATARYRLGFDIGGTVTDFVLPDAETGAPPALVEGLACPVSGAG